MKRKLFIKIIVTLILCMILCFSFIIRLPLVFADAGGYSDDSDWGGSSSSGNDSYSDSSSSSDWGNSWGSGSNWGSGSGFIPSYSGSELGGSATTFIVIITIIVIIAISFINQKKKIGKVTSTTTTRTAPSVVTDSVKIASGLEELQKVDPNFSKEEFLSQIGEMYVRMQTDWQNKKWSDMRALMTESLYKQFDGQLNKLIQAGQTNYIEHISVLSKNITNITKESNNDVITVQIQCRIVDYTIEDQSGKLISESKTDRKLLTYEWQMIRSTDEKTEASYSVSGKASVCPQCGAPLSLDENGKCIYCGADLNKNTTGWKISSINGISQQTIKG